VLRKEKKILWEKKEIIERREPGARHTRIGKRRRGDQCSMQMQSKRSGVAEKNEKREKGGGCGQQSVRGRTSKRKKKNKSRTTSLGVPGGAAGRGVVTRQNLGTGRGLGSGLKASTDNGEDMVRSAGRKINYKNGKKKKREKEKGGGLKKIIGGTGAHQKGRRRAAPAV